MNKSSKLFRKFLILLVISIIISIGGLIYDYQFLKRYFSFIHAGGDPHVIGLNWYKPRFIISKNSPVDAWHLIKKSNKRNRQN